MTRVDVKATISSHFTVFTPTLARWSSTNDVKQVNDVATMHAGVSVRITMILGTFWFVTVCQGAESPWTRSSRSHERQS